jgi:hypothetical protein
MNLKMDKVQLRGLATIGISWRARSVGPADLIRQEDWKMWKVTSTLVGAVL